MSNNIYVYPHAINAYIIGQLGVTVERFCDLHGFVQSTVATWITRERTVEGLPASFIYALSLSANKDMSLVYEDLLKLQDDYTKHVRRNKRTKKNVE